VTAQLLARAREGDGEAFRQLVEPHRRELQVHCYRVLGSLADADDLLQETLLAAWQGLAGFEERASLRSWLYRIATNRCLNWLRAGNRRPSMEAAKLSVEPPEPTRLGDVTWLEPYPDALLDGVTEPDPGPEARYEAREAISLAFITALQLLPPRQRTILILRDVLGFHAAEVAEILQTTEEAVTSALKRARAMLAPELRHGPPPPPLCSPEEERLLAQLVDAFECGDIDGIVALMTEDAWVRMPPVPLEYQGRVVARRFFATVAFREGRRYRLVPTRANRQPAFGVYMVDRAAGIAHAFGLFVVSLSGNEVSAITRFDNAAIARFGLPRTLPPAGSTTRHDGRGGPAGAPTADMSVSTRRQIPT
jgi:RNA polymerase sigma-70 factor (ECF subfamily)